MTDNIKLTSKEYTITLSDNNLQYVLDNGLIEPIKNAVYELDGIDTIMFYNNTFIVDIRDRDLNITQVYSKIIKVIAGHRLTANA